MLTRARPKQASDGFFCLSGHAGACAASWGCPPEQKLRIDAAEGKNFLQRPRRKSWPTKMDRKPIAADFQSGNVGILAAISSVNLGSFRSEENSTSLYTFLTSLYPSSIAFLRYSSDRSNAPIFA